MARLPAFRNSYHSITVVIQRVQRVSYSVLRLVIDVRLHSAEDGLFCDENSVVQIGKIGVTDQARVVVIGFFLFFFCSVSLLSSKSVDVLDGMSTVE
jgi:hypothetical protein